MSKVFLSFFMTWRALQLKCFSFSISEKCNFLVKIRNGHDNLFPENDWDTHKYKRKGNKLRVLLANLSSEIKQVMPFRLHSLWNKSNNYRGCKSLAFFPKDKNIMCVFAEHPELYSTDCIKLCRTATQQVNADGCSTSYKKFSLGMQIPTSLTVARNPQTI